MAINSTSKHKAMTKGPNLKRGRRFRNIEQLLGGIIKLEVWLKLNSCSCLQSCTKVHADRQAGRC
jgi:hypothetical protein